MCALPLDHAGIFADGGQIGNLMNIMGAFGIWG
jgi:hypothetical protein